MSATQLRSVQRGNHIIAPYAWSSLKSAAFASLPVEPFFFIMTRHRKVLPSSNNYQHFHQLAFPASDSSICQKVCFMVPSGSLHRNSQPTVFSSQNIESSTASLLSFWLRLSNTKLRPRRSAVSSVRTLVKFLVSSRTNAFNSSLSSCVWTGGGSNLPRPPWP